MPSGEGPLQVSCEKGQCECACAGVCARVCAELRVG